MDSCGNNGKVSGTAPELFTVEEVAGMLRIHPDRVYRLIREKRLPAVRLGRSIRVFGHVLITWLEEGGTASRDKTAFTFSGETQA